MQLNEIKSEIFNIKSQKEFDSLAIEIFQYQSKENKIYNEYLNHLKINPNKITKIESIPFLPISFFKSKDVFCGENTPQKIFKSSGTTGMIRSKHFVQDLNLYERSFVKAFELFFQPLDDLTVVALLPSYQEMGDSSLIYMVDHFIKRSSDFRSGYYRNHQELRSLLRQLTSENKPTLFIGVSYALLDFIEEPISLSEKTIVMETGGMKGRRKELVREELHQLLKKGLGVNNIYSEYGMTELLSQGYSLKEGRFVTPKWLRIMVRDTTDPLNTSNRYNKTGGINIIDLANLNSCSFIATQDLGKVFEDGSFEVLGRFDNSDIRGCNLLMA